MSVNSKRLFTAWLFVLPAFIFTFIFRYYTMFHSFWISFHDYNIGNPPGKLVWFDNYAQILNNPDYWKAWGNTFVFVLLSLLIVFFIPLIQAIFLSEIEKLRSFFSTMYIIPVVVPLSVNVIIWKWIWNPQYGLANAIMKVLGLPAQAWLSDPDLTKLCIIIPGIVGGGFSVLLYLSAILGISKDIYEAAQIDGCFGFKKLFYITLPNIKFLIIIQMILTIIGSMQILNEPFQYATGGPNGASTSMAIYIYDQMNQRFKYGTASAASMLLLAVIAIITYLQMRLDKSETE